MIALKAQYPDTTPLVAMQLGRIARLKVQLDRVQDVIDASFVAERLSKTGIERAADALGLADDEKAQTANWLLQRLRGETPDVLVDKALFVVSLDLAEIDEYALLTTHEEFETYLPSFCNYITEKAKEHGQTLGLYLSTRLLNPTKVPEAAKGKKLPVSIAVGVPYIMSPHEADQDQTRIRTVEVKTLQRAAAWFKLQTWDFVRRVYRMRALESLAESAQEAAMPDPDKLDRLMRYQTTINRQLSSAMGELLELVKRGCPRPVDLMTCSPPAVPV